MKDWEITYHTPRNSRVFYTMFQRAASESEARRRALAHLGGRNVIVKVKALG